MTELSENMVKIEATDEIQVLKATERAGDLAKRVGLSEADRTKIQISVSELAKNILDHAGRKGNITIGVVRESGKVGIIVVAEDEGPGIKDIASALHKPKPNSSAAGLGIGLGAVQRLMDEFKIERVNSRGTRVTAVKWKI